MYHVASFSISLILAFVLYPVLCSLAVRVGAVDFDRSRPHAGPAVPRAGGSLVMLSAFISLLTIAVMDPEFIGGYADQILKVPALIVGAVLIFALGFIDDIHGLRARWKLLGQVAVAVLVWSLGLRTEVITNPMDPTHPLHLGLWSLPLFVFWVVLCVNAMNIIDGINCLAGGIFSLGVLFFLVNNLFYANPYKALVALALLGGVLAFLVLNYKGRINLGDSGSMLLGYLLASIVSISSPKSSGLASVMIPLGVLSVPIAEVVVTTIRRVLNGKALSQADRSHLHYRLIKRGLKSWHVAIFINIICMLCGLMAMSMVYVNNAKMIYGLSIGWIVLIVLTFSFGYLGLPQSKVKSLKTRNTLFLDHERLLQRRLNNLAKISSHDELRVQLKKFGRELGLVSLSATSTYATHEAGLTLHFDGEHASDEGDSHLQIRIEPPRDSQGLIITSRLKINDRSGDINETVFWLNEVVACSKKWAKIIAVPQNCKTAIKQYK